MTDTQDGPAADLAPLREVIAEYELGAKKSLGQHFLLDLNLTRKIARAANTGPEDTILEIGPGPGGLTRALLETGARVIAIERDERCIAALQPLNDAYPDHLAIIAGDALAIDERALVSGANGGDVKIVSNLPYNISTELLIKWLKLGDGFWSCMALMFQKEVADRILAAPRIKAYGRLSVISQITSTPHRAFDLPARAFTPPPKVNSSVVVFDPPSETFDALPALEALTQSAFSQRRKMLRSSMKGILGDRLEEMLQVVGAAPTNRAEELSPDQFAQLSRAIANHK